MTVVEPLPITWGGPDLAPISDGARAGQPEPTGDWADQTRRVLTRDLLVRAAHARPTEARALQFRALHLNLPVVGDVIERLGLTAGQRRRVEHHGLDGLHEAVRSYDPFGDADFPDVAGRYVEEQILAHLPRPGLRLVAHRVAIALARI
jgi:hypothetical protein